MVELIPHGVYLKNGKTIVNDATGMPSADEARENTIAYRILRAHDKDGSKGKKLRVKFDAMASHDITYVGIIQTARASGLEKFPIPYAMTNCHNSMRMTISSDFPLQRNMAEFMFLQTRQLFTSMYARHSQVAAA